MFAREVLDVLEEQGFRDASQRILNSRYLLEDDNSKRLETYLPSKLEFKLTCVGRDSIILTPRYFSS